jgi:hypothetical protein
MRKRTRIYIAVTGLLLTLGAGLLWADVPVREEQLIYSVLAYNGKDYSATFARRDADTIYILANTDNFLTVRKTLVYFWPLTEDWKTDSSSLNVAFEGKLELTRPDGKVQAVEVTPYTYYNVQGDYELNWKVDQGQAAYDAWGRYQKLMDEYWSSVQEYYNKRALYEEMLNQLTATITKMRDEGKDVTRLVDALKEMTAPPEPQPPKDYIVPPVPVQQAFILNLPVGEYHIRFFTQDGKVMEGSERRVVVFDKRRAQGIGLEVIPGDKWTRPVESKTPASVLYVDGSTDLYLRPFFEQEYNDLDYEKMLQNDARGNPNLMQWVRIQQVPKAQISVSRPKAATETVLEKPYYVEQVKGSALGYTIVPYDPEGAHKDRDPSLRAFRIPIVKDQRVVRLQVQDSSGAVLPGSERQIRIIGPSRLMIISLILALLPLAAMAVVMLRRTRVYSG